MAPANSFVDNLANRAAAKCQYRRSAGHGLDHREPERFWPVDREKQRECLAKKFGFLLLVDFADKFDITSLETRLDCLFEIGDIHFVDLGCDLER